MAFINEFDWSDYYNYSLMTHDRYIIQRLISLKYSLKELFRGKVGLIEMFFNTV